MKRKNKIIAITIGIVILIVIMGLRKGSDKVTYQTAEVMRGDLINTISATGTLEPEEVIDVGAQVAGKIERFGKDENGKTIDYGSQVEEGTILAQIDDVLYKADVDLSKAKLDDANAKLVQAERDWKRAEKLGPSEALAESSYDAYKSAYETAKANVGVAQATLTRSQKNLDYCTIKSPVKGVVIDRRVNIGQTVVSSLNAPSLFLLAKDLKRMQVWVSVNETDIGNIFPGQEVTFTVDAFGGEVFEGKVGKIRYNATMTQNVVTYTVEVITDNSSGKLIPYLTANAKFIVSSSKDALLVPNAAIRWWPSDKEISERYRSEAEKLQKASDSLTEGTVWVEEGSEIKPIKVKIGPNDGTNIEIKDGGIKEGMKVITGQQQKEVQTGTKNPFVPQIRRERGMRGTGMGGGGGGR